jgi:hypothetical protein
MNGRERANVEVAQEAVAQLEDGRRQHEAFAVGQLEQEAGADERRGDARHRRLRDAGQFGQLAIADRGVGRSDAAQHGETAREGGDLVRRRFAISGRGGVTDVDTCGSLYFRNSISILLELYDDCQNMHVPWVNRSSYDILRVHPWFTGNRQLSIAGK